MPCSFSLLGLPRRPLLSEEEIGTAYRKLAGELHPDQTGGDTEKFRELGAAAAILRDPAKRLRELTGVAFENQIPGQASEFFPVIALIFQESDVLTAQAAAASTPLTKALLAAPLKQLDNKLKSTLHRLRDWRAALDQELFQIDQTWPEQDPVVMTLLADSIAYAMRWESQLRERELALESLL